MYSKRNQFITLASSTFIFYKIILFVMNMLVFNFQNMADIHKGYAYQIFIFLTKKELTRVQPSLPKQITKFKIE
jgi:hypothetical protein